MRQHRHAPPIINAPPLVTALTLVIAAAHVARVLAGSWLDGIALDYGAVFPERFWAWAGADISQAMPPYGSAPAALTPLVGTAFVHGDWSHLLMNCIFLIALGKPVYGAVRQMVPGRRAGDMAFLAMFFLCVMGGSLAHLISYYPSGPPAIGASGGVSGLLAAVILMQQKKGGRLLERGFLAATGVFIVANIVLSLVGPQLIGASIAWQAHLGGYAMGAILFRLVIAGYARQSA